MVDPQANRHQRVAHLVGSVPAETAREAMELAVARCGPFLRWVPDGETGERKNWTMHIIEAMRAHDDLVLAREGRWSGYDDTPRFKVRRGRRLDPDSLDFGYVDAFRASYPTFKALRASGAVAPDVAFQVGIPGPLDLALLTLGPAGGLRQVKAFRRATTRQIAAILAESRDNVLFQIEVPFELVMVTRAPAPLRPLVAQRLGAAISRIAAESPIGARFGVHLCLGDLNHEALAAMRDLGPVVVLANAIAARWPAGRPFEFIHAPLAGANVAPRVDDAFLAPLTRLRLPAATRFIAGFAYEHDDLATQREVLRRLEAIMGGPVGVSAACGLGRRSRAEADASLQRVHDLLVGDLPDVTPVSPARGAVDE